MKTAQKKIRVLVEEYKELFTKEYNLFCNSMIDKREIQANQFASLKDSEQMRQFVFEVPLTLHEILKDGLDVEEHAYLYSKEGAEWFGRTFKEFSPAAVI